MSFSSDLRVSISQGLGLDLTDSACAVLKTKPRALCMLGKHFPTELQPSSVFLMASFIIKVLNSGAEVTTRRDYCIELQATGSPSQGCSPNSGEIAPFVRQVTVLKEQEEPLHHTRRTE